MHDCHADVLAYHDEKVTLPEAERREMRKRRDTNRNRLESGLERDDEPSPYKCQSQGSYAHRTMVQQPDKDYDIDDGVYFLASNLVDSDGDERSPHDVKTMVKLAVDAAGFNKPPKVRTNCVRIYYAEGYHVDVPVYRDVLDWLGNHDRYELASSDWKESDPARVTKWFNDCNRQQSPDETNGRQLRRMARLLKGFARSRSSWRDGIATGFMITTLLAEGCYRSDNGREDRALYRTMQAMSSRLHGNLRIMHPVVMGEELTTSPEDSRTRFLLDKLDAALDALAPLFDTNCTRKQALKAWDKAFGTDFFSGRDDTGGKTSGSSGSATISENRGHWEPPDAVRKRGGGRYA